MPLQRRFGVRPVVGRDGRFLADPPPGLDTDSTTYVLVVRTADGRTEQVGTWSALPGRTLQVVGATASRRGNITSVEVRTASGVRLLELTRPKTS